jgi:hypothetical protein
MFRTIKAQKCYRCLPPGQSFSGSGCSTYTWTAAKGANAGVKVDFHDNVTTATGTFNRTVTVDENAIKEDSLLAGFLLF